IDPTREGADNACHGQATAEEGGQAGAAGAGRHPRGGPPATQGAGGAQQPPPDVGAARHHHPRAGGAGLLAPACREGGREMSKEAAVKAVAYWRMSSSPQEKSIPQQRAEMLPRAKLAGLQVVRDFEDEAISGGGMSKRDSFRDLVRFCQAEAKQGRTVEAIVCFDTSRFSRATSIETAHYVWELQQAGTHRVFTWERWFDFRKEEDRAIFLLQ